ncbi:uncharacterized protein PHALS_13522 [Plasmopara halstedii]|uniref:Uncharacterized protein n=1 Tax=Plasmopara halstedii TaxID=4781 RepID=A0A0P1APT7_PLAHL|nr:uncharacterized protein PHALS_13522 [Plasmopara halstedii]CEG43319.1 hypothetical protein PHALS_13522 [Plasmopara halstedii]|eukprot:XP_024579688.1 hypothetical protein PHALS_13522 [Plasmopara halstedii]
MSETAAALERYSAFVEDVLRPQLKRTLLNRDVLAREVHEYQELQELLHELATKNDKDASLHTLLDVGERFHDGARYKTQLVQAVDSLFAKATTRAFRRMAAIVLQWVFQSWKAVTKRSKRKNHLALKILEKLRIRRIWTSWRLFVYERHMIGTMMFAKARQREAKENMLEIAKLHGDNFERESADRMQNAIQREIVQKLEKQLAAERSLVQLKDRQLLELRGVENMLTLENV